MSQSLLALNGGDAAFPEGPPGWPPDDDEVREALLGAYADGSWGRYDGPNCRRLEQLLREWLDVEFVQLAASGTIAVEMALRGLGVGESDEVILSAYDFAGNFRAVEALGARPVLIDLAERSWRLDERELQRALSDRTRAVIVSHLHGCLAPMRAIREWASQNQVLVLEDACQVPGADVNARLAGCWGDAATFSFGGSKLLTSGRGGAVITPRAEVQQRIRIYYERGNSAAPLSELQAAVLPPQVAKLSRRNEIRADRVDRLLTKCEELSALEPATQTTSPNGSAFYKVPWRLKVDGLERVREWFIAACRAEGVAIDSGFRGFVRRGSRRCRRIGELENAREAAQSTVLLHHPVLLESATTIDRVAAALAKVIRAMPQA